MTSTSPTLPDWLATPAEVVVPQRRQHPFVRASLRRATELAATIHAGVGGLDRFDPRVKLVGALSVLVALACLHSSALLCGAAVALVALAAACGVGRSLLALGAPVLGLTAVLLLPATLSVVRPGPVALQLWTASGVAHGLTTTGLAAAVVVLARVLGCLTVVVLLTRTTSWLRLMSALRAVGTPPGFVLVATMAHRYLLVLLEVFTDLLLARRARSVGGARQAEDRAFFGGTVAAVFTRSTDLADDVHQAMVARGFTGRLRDPAPKPLRAADAAVAIGCLVASGLLVWGDLVVR